MDANMNHHHDIYQGPAVPQAAARAYLAQTEAMLARVQDHMAALADLGGPARPGASAMMFNNHRNHALLMANVLEFSAYETLAWFIPWVYQTYNQRGFSYTYFATALRAWAETVRDTLPAEHSEPILAVYEWLLARHEHWIELAESQAQPALHTAPGFHRRAELFLAGLLQNNVQECVRLLAEEVRDGDSFLDFALGVIQPAMYAIGDMWARGEISLVREHAASAVAARVLASAQSLVLPAPERQGRALVTAAPNELHELGPRMVALALEAMGWQVSYLGGNTPADVLAEEAARHQPEVIAVSVCMVFNLIQAREAITRARAAAPPGALVLAGGQAFGCEPGLAERVGADALAADAREAAKAAGSWRRASRGKASA